MSPRPIESYQVGVICALPKEMLAARAMLDEEHEPPSSRDAQDFNTYVLGRVHDHNVVIACLPAGIYGTNQAATTANNMLRTFPGIRFGLMIGIGGGIPGDTKETDVRLGDVVISQPQGPHGGVVQYDLGKDLGKGKFERKGTLKQPPTILLTALSSIQAQPGTTRRQLAKDVAIICQKASEEDEGYLFPGIDRDHLFCSRCDRSRWSPWQWLVWIFLFWLSPMWLCDVCNRGIVRRPLDRTDAKLYYGIIASANVLIKNSIERDRLRDEFKAMAIETEAAGLMNDFPCLVIRGICDYADSHKNDVWQNYAAVTAAAFAKILLSTVSPTVVYGAQHAKAIMESKDIRTHELLSENNQLHRQGVEEFRKQARTVEARYSSDRERRCHQAFKKEGSYEEQKNINPKKVAGTCQWVLDHTQYKAWQQSTTDSLLWISADPGCGKSVLSRSLVDYDLVDRDERVVCYFFFKDNPSQDNIATALCAVLHQLFHQQPGLLHHALPSWERNHDKIQQESEEMWRILLAAAGDSGARPIVCVLDALDECQDEDRRRLINKLCEFYRPSYHTPASVRLKFLVTSRPYDNVQRWFEETTSQFPQIRLRGEENNDQLNKEINLVIDQRIRELAADFNLSISNQNALRDRLQRMQHRTYLWLYLAYEEIRATYLASFARDDVQIDSLPESVEDAYERILQRIHKKHRLLARRILLIIVGARRPLTVTEMGLAIGAALAHESNQSNMKINKQQPSEEQIRELCGLFVFVQHSQLFLIHQTAKEFLVAKTVTSDLATGRWRYSLDDTQIQREMACLCVTYIYLADQNDKVNGSHDSSKPVYDGDKIDRHIVPRNSEVWSQPWSVRQHFFQYCAVSWTSHLQEDAFMRDPTLADKVRSLYATDGKQFQSWFPVWWKELYPHDPTPALQTQHVVSMEDHPLILREILNAKGVELEARDSTNRTALHWAAEMGHEKVVQMLLDAGANINAEGGGHYGNALQAASDIGYEKVIEVLLDAGADVTAQAGHYGDALHAASAGGHEKIVKMLLDAGADVNAQGGHYINALHAASAGGHEKIVEVLLDAGADVNAQEGRHYGDALHAASVGGHEKMVEMLLDAGADVNAQGGGHYGNALCAASARGHEKIVKMLLDAGADVNAQGGKYNSALQIASAGGHEKMVEMLLDAGADVNAQGEDHDNALHAASVRGHEKIVEMLLDAGADVNAQGGCYGNALHAVSARGCEIAVKILLDAGADVNTQGGYYGNALQAASARGCEIAVKILLDTGADVNAQGGYYGSVLGAALVRGHEKIVEMLRDAGAK